MRVTNQSNPQKLRGLMKKLLEFLLPICFHEWEIECKQKIIQPDLFGFDWEGKPEKLPIGLKYTLRCKKCGEMKTHHDY